MGRHRRSAAGRKGKGDTPTPPVTGTAPAAGDRPGQEQYRTTYDAHGSYPQGSDGPYVRDDAYGHGDPAGSYRSADSYGSSGHGHPYGGDDYARSQAYLFGTEESSAPVHADAPTAALPAQ
ncbi:hypothetical protein HW445_25135, partial [Streptomyces sp. UH6]|nr:hypothetical protein [Streptomyces sp. UH6]